MFKIATWNVNSIRVRLPQVTEWLDAYAPDVLAVQETKSEDKNFPATAFEELGYHVIFSGQKTFNGMAIMSKSKPEDIVTDIPGLDDPQRRVLAATIGDIRVLDLYVPNGQEVGSDKYAYKLDWLSKANAFVKQQLAEYPKLVVLGDFNVAPDDRDVYDPSGWKGHVLVSEKERAALQSLMDLGLTDSFRLFNDEAGYFSWWDYRAGGFVRDHGLRIDLVLLSSALASSCVSCQIDKEPRGWEQPSDHAPVMATIST